MEIAIAPEALEVAQTYLMTMSVELTAKELKMSRHEVAQWLDNKQVKAFVDRVFLEQGYNNRFRLQAVMDDLIEKKLEELDDADLGSNKDIADLLVMKHKMATEQLKLMIEYEKAKTPSSQTNVQVNNQFGENYGKLLDKLLK